MARRYYANNAPQRTLASQITSGATSCTVSGTFSGWPTSFPFYAALDIGTASFEIVSVTNIVGSTATIVRAQDGTAAISHPAGATLDQVVVRQDFDEANAHVNANTGVHGVSGSVVGTSDSQTLSNKTLSSPTLTGTMNGAGAINTTGNIATSGTVSAGGSATAASFVANGNGVASGVLLPKLYTNEAARDAAITSPATGMTVYLTAPTGGPIGLYEYQGTWKYIAAGTPWTSYTPALTAATTNPTLGTGSVQSAEYRINGDMLECRGYIAFGTSGAAAGSGSYFISLPPGVSLVDGRPGGARLIGSAIIKSAGAFTFGVIHGEATTSPFSLRWFNAGALTPVSSASPGAFTNNDSIAWEFTARIS